MKRPVLLVLTCGLLLCQITTYPPTGGGSGNATTVNGAAVPLSVGVLASNSSRQLVSAVPVGNNFLSLSLVEQQNSTGNYVQLTDGTGDFQPGFCGVYGVDIHSAASGVLTATSCLTDTGTGFSIGTGQSIYADHTTNAIIRATQMQSNTPVAIGSLPSCTSALDSRMYYVNDALAPTFLTGVSNGGSARTWVFCDASTTTWRAF